MTYKNVVDRIELAVNDHRMLADFGYGQLSDIKVLDEDGDGANYPYAFLNPAGVTRNQQATTYSFNLIMMEMALTPHDALQIQSDCIQYLNDIISELRFDPTFAPDVQLTNSIQVFKERFQDEVAGATATFNIVVADPINNCDAPFGEWVVYSSNSYSREDITFNTAEQLTPRLCELQSLGNQIKLDFDIRYNTLVDLERELYKYLTVFEFTTNEETGESVTNILARHEIVVPASGEVLQWSPIVEIDCSLDELAGNKFLGWGFGATSSEGQPTIQDAMEIDGTVTINYKR